MALDLICIDSALADVTTDENFSRQGKLPKDNMKAWDYKTFIPYKTVADPKPEILKTYLKGDNRGFSDTSNKFRTQAMVNTQFHSPTSITLFKDVSQSVRCSDPDCKKVIERKTASNSGIKLHITSKKRITSIRNIIKTIQIGRQSLLIFIQFIFCARNSFFLSCKSIASSSNAFGTERR